MKNLTTGLACIAIAALILSVPTEVWAAFSLGGGGFSNDPFDKGKSWMMKMGNGVSLIVTGAAFLGGMVVIALAMAGKLRADWAGKICGGLVAMTGLTWIIESITN